MWGTSRIFFLISPGVVKKFGRPIFFGGKYFTILVPPNLADEIFGQNQPTIISINIFLVPPLSYLPIF